MCIRDSYWTLRAALVWTLVLAGELFWLSSSRNHSALRAAIPALTVLFAAAHVIVMPRWRYRVHRWEVTSTAVYTQSGWLVQERRIAPLSRVQTVDTARGPLEQLFRPVSYTH